MTYNKIKNKIRKFSNDPSINKNIIRKIKGSYYLYNTYKITNNNGIWEVLRNNYFVHGFESSATATTWCIADKMKQYMDAHNLIIIDQKLQRMKNDVQHRTKLINQSNLDDDRKNIAIARLTQDLHTCKCLKNEIDQNFSKRLNTHNLQDFKL